MLFNCALVSIYKIFILQVESIRFLKTFTFKLILSNISKIESLIMIYDHFKWIIDCCSYKNIKIRYYIKFFYYIKTEDN